MENKSDTITTMNQQQRLQKNTERRKQKKKISVAHRTHVEYIIIKVFILSIMFPTFIYKTQYLSHTHTTCDWIVCACAHANAHPQISTYTIRIVHTHACTLAHIFSTLEHCHICLSSHHIHICVSGLEGILWLIVMFDYI